MGRYLLEGDTLWMRTCEVCGGAWRCAPPEDSGASPNWTCERCAVAARGGSAMDWSTYEKGLLGRAFVEKMLAMGLEKHTRVLDASWYDAFCAIASRAVELVAARGGTMTTERRREARRYADALSSHNALHDVLDAFSAQSAALAKETERADMWMRTAQHWEKEATRLEQHISDLEKSLENARKERDEARHLVGALHGASGCEAMHTALRAEAACAKENLFTAVRERDAWRTQAEARDPAYEKALSERNEALADNAGLLKLWQDTGCLDLGPRVEAEDPSSCIEQGWPLTGVASCAACRALGQPHPGAALLERLRRLEEALRSLEWSDEQYTTGKPCCPSCGAEETAGHANGCLVGAALTAGH